MNETVSELQSMWENIKNELKNAVDDQRFFDVFLSESSIHSIENGTMTVSVNSNLAVTIFGS